MKSPRRCGLLGAAALLLAGSGCYEIEVNQNPELVPADSVTWLEPDNLVLGLPMEPTPRAYPIPAMAPIEVLNDTVEGMPVVVTWCPLSGTGAVFSADVNGESRTFRFHPELHKMNLLMQDVETESLWSQLESAAIDGASKGARLRPLPMIQTTWSAWRRMYPESQVMAPEWGTVEFSYREPRGDPSEGPRELDLAIVVAMGDGARVYPFPDLAQAQGPVSDSLGGGAVVIHYSPRGPWAFATDDTDRLIPSLTIYWQYLGDFFPETELWRGGSLSPASAEPTAPSQEASR